MLVELLIELLVKLLVEVMVEVTSLRSTILYFWVAQHPALRAYLTLSTLKWRNLPLYGFAG